MKKLILVLVALVGLIGSVSAQMSEIKLPDGEKYFVEVHEICFYDNCTDKKLSAVKDYWLESAQFYYNETLFSKPERAILFRLLNSYDVREGYGGAVCFTYEAKQYPYNKETLCAWVVLETKSNGRGYFYRGK